MDGTWKFVGTTTLFSVPTLAFAEVGISDWSPFVAKDPAMLRPAEVDVLIGDASKAKTKLGWQPEVDFPGLVRMMVRHDLAVESARLGK